MPTTQRNAGWQLFIARFPSARFLWIATIKRLEGSVAGDLRAYSLGGKVVIVHDYGNDSGWTIYMDPSATLNIDKTFDLVAGHIGVEESSPI